MISSITIFKFITYIVLIIAITIGYITKYQPELFFKIPNNGYVYWAKNGGHMPPYIVPGPFEDGQNDWLRDGDVIVTAAAKSGTTWMLYCSHQIRVKGDDTTYPFRDVSYTTPWPELIQKPGYTWKKQKDLLNNTILNDGTPLWKYWNHPNYKFRIFKSHNPSTKFGSLVKDGKIKFLAMTRNNIDQIESMVPFFQSHHEKFRKLWGGFPPVVRNDATIKELTKERFQQCLPGGLWSDHFFPYLDSWWNVKHQSNVMLLHYSDAKRDLSGTVQKLAQFYDIQLTDEEHKTVTNKCSFNYMKDKQHMFEYKLPLNQKFNATIMKNGSMIRKGQIGNGKDYFTNEQKEIWKQEEIKHYGNDIEKLEWSRNGGRIY